MRRAFYYIIPYGTAVVKGNGTAVVKGKFLKTLGKAVVVPTPLGVVGILRATPDGEIPPAQPRVFLVGAKALGGSRPVKRWVIGVVVFGVYLVLHDTP